MGAGADPAAVVKDRPCGRHDHHHLLNQQRIMDDNYGIAKFAQVKPKCEGSKRADCAGEAPTPALREPNRQRQSSQQREEDTTAQHCASKSGYPERGNPADIQKRKMGRRIISFGDEEGSRGKMIMSNRM